MIVLLAAAAWLFAVSPLPAHAQDHVKFGWAKVLAGPAVSGLQQFASKYNLTIDLQEFKRFPDIRTALTTDSVDIGMLGAQEVPLVLSQGVTNLVVISGIDVGGTGVVARKGVTIAQWKDLYGKHIAAGQGGSAWTQFVAATTENGIDYSKLDMYNIVGGGFDHVRALERGDADAVVSWEPYMAAAVVRGVGTYVPLSIIDTKAAGAQVTVIVASKKFASEHPDLVVKVVKSLIEFMDYLQTKPEKWVEVLVGWGFDVPTASLAIKNIKLSPNLEQDRIEGLARFLFKVGLAKSDVSSKLFPEYFTYEFLTKATGKSAQSFGATK